MIKVKPKETGAKVLKPDGVLLNPAGEDVEPTTYWVRRLRDGDVVKVENGAADNGARNETKKQGGK